MMRTARYKKGWIATAACLTTLAGLCGRSAATQAQEAPSRVDSQLRWCGAGVDIDDIKNAAACGAQAVQCNLDNWAWQTPLAAKGGVLGGDPFADFVTVCRQNHVLPIAYMGGFTKSTAPYLLKEHPDWLQVKADGTPDTNGRLCYNSPFGAFMIQRTAELARKYDLAGIWLDGFNPLFVPCYCRYCKEAYAQASGGAAIPLKFDPSNPNAIRYVRWRIKMQNDFSAKLRDAIHKANPKTAVLGNFSAAREWGKKTDWPLYESLTGSRYIIPSMEMWWDNPGDAVYQSFAIQSMRAATEDGPSEVWMVTRPRGVDGTAPTRTEIRCRMFNVIANGSWPDIVADPGDLARSKMCFDDMRARQPYLIGTRRHHWAAMLLSEKTRIAYGYADPKKYMDSLYGTFRAVSEEHLPVSMITDEDIEAGRLADYDVLLLPNAACLSDSAITAIKDYVRNGGGLVASLETSLYDDWGKRRPDFGLSELFGASYVGLEDHTKRDHAERIRFDDKNLIADDPIIRDSRWYIRISSFPNARGSVDFIGYSTDVQRTGNAQVVGVKFNPGTIEGTKERPSVLASAYGKGRVVYLASGMGGSYYNDGNPYQRRILHNALLWAARAKPKVAVTAPMAVQTTYYEQSNATGNRLIVHLLNDQSSWGRHSLYQQTWPTREEVLPIYDIRVDTTGLDVKRAHLEPGGKTLKMRHTGGTTEIDVPRLDIHAMVVLELNTPSHPGDHTAQRRRAARSNRVAAAKTP